MEKEHKSARFSLDTLFFFLYIFVKRSVQSEDLIIFLGVVI